MKIEFSVNFIINRCEENGYEFLGFVGGKYKNKDTKLILHCPLHNVIWYPSVNNFKRGKSKCESCSRISSSNLQILPEQEALNNISEKCKEKGFTFIGFVNCWTGTKKTFLILKCPIHGNWNTTIYNSFLSGRGCPSCGMEISKNSKRYSEEKAIMIIKEKCKEKSYEFIGFVDGTYWNEKSKIIIRCLNHDEWNLSYNQFISGSGCPICGKQKSKII